MQNLNFPKVTPVDLNNPRDHARYNLNISSNARDIAWWESHYTPIKPIHNCNFDYFTQKKLKKSQDAHKNIYLHLQKR